MLIEESLRLQQLARLSELGRKSSMKKAEDNKLQLRDLQIVGTDLLADLYPPPTATAVTDDKVALIEPITNKTDRQQLGLKMPSMPLFCLYFRMSFSPLPCFYSNTRIYQESIPAILYLSPILPTAASIIVGLLLIILFLLSVHQQE